MTSNFGGNDFLAKLKKRQYFYQSLKFAIGLAIAFAICQFPLHSLEFLTYDNLFRLKPPKPTSQKVVTVGIDNKTFNQFNQNPKAKEHIQFLQNLQKSKPKLIVYLVAPDKIEGKQKQLNRLAYTINKSKTDFIVSIPDLDVGANTKLFQLKKPFENISTYQGILSEDKVNFGGDGVSRRALLEYQGKPFVHLVAAQKINPNKNASDYQGAFPFKGSTQVLVNTHRSASFPLYSFLDVYNNKIESANFKDKIVLVGQASDFDSKDFVRSVYSRDITAMPTIEYHANIIDTLIQDDGIIQSPQWMIFLLTAIISLISVYFTFKLSPIKGIAFILLTAFIYSFISYLNLFFLDLWLPLTQPLLALFATYYFLIPYRLISENKKSWEYQQKNKLLTQVEELKNNFISMMSHDLKTPIARIQGMAELASHNVEDLSEEQKKALSNIKNSTVELNTFINSILNLSRVESKGLQLRKESKDINNIVEEVIEKNKYQANQKNIKIIFEPEPLFSIKLDVDLMRQVLHNLIENAIKYSPENSNVLISTEEVNGKVSIQVADQGLGIDEDEIDKIFYKFYRSKSAKVSSVKGSGLGLYLSDYFIKLHKGEIHVESVPKQGSTFTVNLPL